MKILCVSDYHANEEVATNVESIAESEKVDVIINAGDFVSETFAKKILDATRFRTFVVRGNWDSEIRSDNEKVSVLKSDVVEYKGYYFLGSEWGFHSNIVRLAKDIDRKKLILITHEPPYDILDLTFTGMNAGLVDLRAIINEVRPLVHVFGHIHESSGFLKHRGTLFVNAAIPEFRKAYIVSLPSLKIDVVDV